MNKLDKKVSLNTPITAFGLTFGALIMMVGFVGLMASLGVALGWLVQHGYSWVVAILCFAAFFYYRYLDRKA